MSSQLAPEMDAAIGTDWTAQMTTHKKLMLGGLGALTPILVNFLALDLETTLSELTAVVALSYALRVVVLFYLGGIVAFLHKNEKTPLRFFELGIIAPAIITSLMNANQVNAPKAKSTSAPQSIMSILVPTAFAQSAPEKTVKEFSPPKETLGEQFWRGLTGSRSGRIWFVIAGSKEKLEDAEKQAREINQKYPGFAAEVYDRFGDNPHYAVVIGANITYNEATVLRRKAAEAGLARDTYLWKYPDE